MIASARLLAVTFLGAAAVFAQSASSTGALECRVADAQGAAIPSARLTLQHKATGEQRAAATDAQGVFRYAGLALGDYSLHIDHDGFNPVSITPIRISLGQTVVQRVTMTLAAVTEKLEVHEQADSLQVAANTANVALGGDRIEEAPAANRNFLNFVLTAPGAATSPRANTGRSTAGMRNVGNDSGFVFLGMRGRNNSISIDGVDNRDETTGGNRVAVGLEMVQEFRVAAASVSAEFGGAAGGLVNMVTHTGQNLWHGDFTFFHQNERLNGRNPEDDTPTKARFRRYQPGVSIGGPLRADRTFFFAALEHSTESTQDFSAAPDEMPALTRGLFNTGESDTTFALKATHKLPTGGTLSARYAFSRGRVDKDVQSVDNFTDLSARGSSRIVDHSLVGGYASSITPALLSDLRGQFSQRSSTVTPNGAGAMIEIPGLVAFGRGYRMDQLRTERHWEAVESLSWFHGRHTVSAGASIHRVAFNAAIANRFHGVFLFSSLGDYAAGRADVFFQAFGDPRTRFNTYPVGLWLQDKVQITPSLSMEAGVRYDYQRLPQPFPSPVGNVAPRLGLAWHPSGKSGWVFRAGAGLFFDRYPLEYLNDAVQKDGVRGFEQYAAGAAAAAIYGLTRGASLTAPFAGLARTAYLPAPGFTSTYSRKFTVGTERRLDANTTFTFEYSDVRGLHLPRLRNAALTLPPQFQTEQTALSSYRGASLSVNRRLSNELTYLVTYNVGTTRDDSSDYDEQPLDPRNIRKDWAYSRMHQRHRLAISGVYELPMENFAPESLEQLLDKWTLAPVVTLGSARPLNTLLSSDVYRTGAYPLTARPQDWPRNSQRAPRIVGLDLRLMKTIPFDNDRSRLQFGVEAFNVLNHTNRLRVNPYLGPNFGTLVESLNPRQVQLMIQFEY